MKETTMTVTASAATNLASYKSRAQKIAEENADLILGSILWFSITEGMDPNSSVPVRVSPDQLERWFIELGLDTKWLPPRLTQVNAFRKSTSEVNHRYQIDGRTHATLRTIEVTYDSEKVIRHLLRDVTYQLSEDELKLAIAEAGGDVDEVSAYTTTTTHVATLRFFRGARSSAGQRHAAQHYKTQILPELVEIGTDNKPTGRKFELLTSDRDQIELALGGVDGAYKVRMNFLQSQALRGMLRKYLASMNAVMCKPSGGVYFVHSEHQQTVLALQELLRRIGDGCSMTLVALWDEPEHREMLTDALAREVEVDCRKLLVKIAEVNDTSSNGKISPEQYASINSSYQDVVDRAEEYADKLGIAQKKAGASLELTLMGLAALSKRVDPKLSKRK